MFSFDAEYLLGRSNSLKEKLYDWHNDMHLFAAQSSSSPGLHRAFLDRGDMYRDTAMLIEFLESQLEAAKNDLRLWVGCNVCKHRLDTGKCALGGCYFNTKDGTDHFEWRGPQEEKEV